ncbi:MAG: VCBS repeat-containing protein, partial [Pseudomonadota bacterium]|nr:VCBS repeat-containing protein [Pseudomonadota bacterium]
GGFTCGTAADDNARSLSQTIPIIATFRATVVTQLPTPTRARGDVDGDGRSDLLLQNAGVGQSAYWIMNGAVPVRYSSAFTQPAGYARVATGDFNGDSRLDIVWARSSDRQLLLWQGDGTGFTQLAIRDYSAGWAVTGAGDIDGDGRSDLLLANASQGVVAYWTMNGATPVRYSSAFVQPDGYVQVANGDFNGDGRLDLVWARASDRNLLLWQGDGNGFTALAIGPSSSGWAVTGAGDIDGDGRSDLLLANASTGQVAYWVMNGATAQRYSAAFVQPAGYAQVTSGDYNGDGRLDLVWVRASDRHVLLWQGDGNGFASLPVGNYSEGWLITQP